MRWQPGMNLSGLLNACNEMLAEPLPFEWSNQTPRFLLIFTGLYAVIVLAASSEHRNTRPGEEHGSARWGNAKELNRRYRDTQGPNLLMTRNIRIGVDGYKHKHNTNVLVVGGSGTGKTRTYAVPNVLEAGCSMVITDHLHTERRLSYPEHRYPQDQAHRTLRQTSQGVSGNAPPDTVQ